MIIFSPFEWEDLISMAAPHFEMKLELVFYLGMHCSMLSSNRHKSYHLLLSKLFSKLIASKLKIFLHGVVKNVKWGNYSRLKSSECMHLKSQ